MNYAIIQKLLCMKCFFMEIYNTNFIILFGTTENQKGDDKSVETELIEFRWLQLN